MFVCPWLIFTFLFAAHSGEEVFGEGGGGKVVRARKFLLQELVRKVEGGE